MSRNKLHLLLSALVLLSSLLSSLHVHHEEDHVHENCLVCVIEHTLEIADIPEEAVVLTILVLLFSQPISTQSFIPHKRIAYAPSRAPPSFS